MNKRALHKKLAETVVSKLRDENYAGYLHLKNQACSVSPNDHFSDHTNSLTDDHLQKLHMERLNFIRSLNEEQLLALDKLVLNMLDNTAFNFLREIEENLHSDNSLGLTIANEKVETIQSEFLSGSLFGEYFLWIKEHSKYGTFQH